MNTLRKVLFWSAIILLGFINPIISVILVVIYYLPKIIQDVCQPSNNDCQESEMKSYSEDILKDMK